MTQAQTLPPLTKDLLDAFIAFAALWLTRLLSAVLHPNAYRRRKLLTAFVRRTERFVEHVIFLQAVHACGPTPKRRAKTPRSAPPGFRRVQRRFTLFWKIARIRAPRSASLADRLAQLLHAIAHPDRYVARFLKQLYKGLRLNRLIAIAPQRMRLRALASLRLPPTQTRHERAAPIAGALCSSPLVGDGSQAPAFPPFQCE